ncbi:MAG: hypothetical protein WBO66_01795 [Candidatus Moraniibacteriota bacterium]
MKRYFSILMILCSFVFSSFASASEWEVKGGDTLWKILAEACQVKPSMQKVRVFARATGIQTPSLIVIGERIDVSRGCAALPDVIAVSLEKAVVLLKQQGETLHGMEVKLASLEKEATKLQSSEKRGTTGYGSSVKEYHAFGDPVVFFTVCLILVVALCLFIWFALLRRSGVGALELPGEKNEHETPFREGASIHEVSLRSEKRDADHGGDIGVHSLDDLPALAVLAEHSNIAERAGIRDWVGRGYITLTVPFAQSVHLGAPYTRLIDVGIVSRWRIIPNYVDGRGYETFMITDEGNPVCVETLRQFRESIEESLRLFLERIDDERSRLRIYRAIESRHLDTW